ncbi:MAG: porphobilinogen synthase [Candidatus Melainabacteria bacterium HGW-Melainabacteria-1]|nr:MAG: porphobilinogen synthase [Candidatus Melainabacteria bacterium HGW-Melainabacteria-1]
MSELIHRPRRLRRTPLIRDLAREHRLHLDDFVYPLFIDEHLKKNPRPLGTMPGVLRHSLHSLIEELKELEELNVRHLLLFGIPKKKDAFASEAHAEDGIVQQALRLIRERFGNRFQVITDVCNCEYTDHGHCGLLKDGEVDNDPTVELLVKTALSHARAGADMIAPSDMMDGRIGAIRRALDAEGFEQMPIMAYSAKFASAYYGPFREAADSAPAFGDRRAYQMDPANAREALKEVRLDLAEGADIVMVKPALAYLDLVWRVKQATDVPVAVYNVSGEYSMIKAAVAQGWVDERKIVIETLTSFKRAGADIIISYHSKDLAKWLLEEL